MIDPLLIAFGLGLLVLTGAALLLTARAPTVSPAEREDAALAIFSDQLGEIDREEGRGLISAVEAGAARTEIKRRMLAADRVRQRNATGAVRTGGRTLVVLAVLVPVAGLGVYFAISNPAGRAVASGASERQAPSDIANLAAQVRARLEAEGEGATEGWLLLARTYAGMGDTAKALEAYARVADRDDVTADGLARYGELLVVTDGGTVSAAAIGVLDRALAIAPDPRATYYRAVAFEQEARYADALALVETRLAAGADEEALLTLETYRDALRERMILPPTPDAAAVEAAGAMSATDREAFIGSMVDGLAARLEANPDDLDGWLRLANAYDVLERPADALRAYQSAEPLLDGVAEGDPRRVRVADGLAANAVE